MVGVLLFAFALYTRALASESISIDEGLTLTFALAEPSDILSLYSQIDEYHPPVHYLAWHFWIVLMGRSEFAARALSVMAVLLATALAYQIGRKIYDGNVGVAASLLIASSGFQVYYAQTVRAYSLLELFSLGSLYCFLSLIRRPTLKAMRAYALITTVLIYTHLYGFFILLAQNISFIIQLGTTKGAGGWPAVRTKLGNWLFLQVTIAGAFMPWLPMIIYQFGHFTTTVEGLPPLALAASTFLEFTWSVPAFVLAVCVFATGFYGWMRQCLTKHRAASPTTRELAGLPWIWLLSNIGLPLAISLLFKPVFLPRYGIAALPAFFLLTAWIALRRLPFGSLLVGLMIVLQLAGVRNLYQGLNNEQWREAVQYLNPQLHPRDWVLIYSGWAKGSFDYYAQRTDLHEISLHPANGPAQLQAALTVHPNQPAIWLVLVYRDETALAAILKEHGFTATHQRDYFRIALRKYEKILP